MPEGDNIFLNDDNHEKETLPAKDKCRFFFKNELLLMNTL